MIISMKDISVKAIIKYLIRYKGTYCDNSNDNVG